MSQSLVLIARVPAAVQGLIDSYQLLVTSLIALSQRIYSSYCSLLADEDGLAASRLLQHGCQANPALCLVICQTMGGMTLIGVNIYKLEQGQLRQTAKL